MKIMMHNTKVKLPKAPIVLPIIEMSKLSVGHDFANLNTRSCKYKLWNKASHKLAHRRFTYATALDRARDHSQHSVQLLCEWSWTIIILKLANVCLSNLSMCIDLVCMSGIYVIKFCESFCTNIHYFLVLTHHLLSFLYTDIFCSSFVCLMRYDIDPIS